MWIEDRLNDGRHVAQRTLRDGRKVAERTLADGGKVAGRAWLDSRRAAERAYDGGREVADRTWQDSRREAERRFEQGRHLVTDRLDDGRRALGDSRKAVRDRFASRAPAATAAGVSGAVVWSGLLVAAGAGVAYLCWNQFVRARARRQAGALDDAGGEGPSIPSPEQVLAHNPPPEAQGGEVVDRSDAQLAEPAETLLTHTPVEDAPTAKPKAAKAIVAAATAAEASRPESLESSLAVQGATSAPMPKSADGATTEAVKPRRKGPTVM